jgi:methoxymalonate biosynthesis acyl carrier protein
MVGKAGKDSTRTIQTMHNQEVGTTMEENKAKIKAFLARFFRNHEFKDDEDIFALGFVNSMFAMQLVMFVENEFKVTIENEDLDFENFRTVDAIAGLIERKTAPVTQQG